MIRKTTILLLSLSCMLLAQFQMTMDSSDTCNIQYRGQNFGSIYAGYFLPEWNNRNFPPQIGKGLENNTLTILGGKDDDKTRIQMTMSYELVGDNAIHFSYVFTPQQDMNVHSVYSTLSIDASHLINHPFFANGERAGICPEVRTQNIHLFSNKISNFAAETDAGRVNVTFDEKTPALWQDNRQWGTSIGLRMGINSEKPGELKKDVEYKVAYTITFPEKLVLEVDSPVTLAANDEWIELKAMLDIEPGSALDFTDVIKRHAPAGKFGALKAVGPNFEFENRPGVPQRFYGVNFCFSAHNITPEQSEILAERLARLGYNAVRYHHYERNICQTVNGDSTQLNPQKMVMFDAMFAAMKKHGLYATTDLYVSRSVRAGEIWPDSPNPMEAVNGQMFKRLCAVNRNAMENLKKFTRNFLTHVNPHTGLSYADDPSLCLINLLNEGIVNGFNAMSKTTDKRLYDEWLKSWNKWLLDKYGTAEERNKAWNAKEPEVLTELPTATAPAANRDFQQFMASLEINMYREMRDFLKNELHCKALLTNMNNGGKNVWAQFPRHEFDYVDDHFYIDHPTFIKKSWSLPSRCSNVSVVKSGTIGGTSNSFTRLLDKPFTITEFNYSGPGRYRGVGGILTGCLAAIQNWSGLWRFAYSHSSAMFTPHGAGYFDLVSDPLNQAAERATLCLYLRGDLQEAKHTIAVTIADDQLTNPNNQPMLGTTPKWSKLNTLAKVGTFIAPPDATVPGDISVPFASNAPQAQITFNDLANNTTAEQGQAILDKMRALGWIPQDNLSSFAAGIIQSDNGQFTINSKQDMMILDTPRTAGAFATPGNSINTNSLKLTIHDTDATVWVSSLSDAPIRTAKRLLISHLTDLQNTGAKFNEKAHKTILSFGKMPYLVRYGRADLLLKLEHHEQATVYAINLSGKRIAKLLATVTDDGLQLTLDVKGPEGAQMLYEIVRE